MSERILAVDKTIIICKIFVAGVVRRVDVDNINLAGVGVGQLGESCKLSPSIITWLGASELSDIIGWTLSSSRSTSMGRSSRRRSSISSGFSSHTSPYFLCPLISSSNVVFSSLLRPSTACIFRASSVLFMAPAVVLAPLEQMPPIPHCDGCDEKGVGICTVAHSGTEVVAT